MKLYIITQDYENYAWVDGELLTGKDAYWKAKGGRDIFVPLVGGEDVDAVVASVRDRIECANDGYMSTIIGYEVVEDSYMTDFEKSQLEYEGRIAYPAEVIDMETV